MPEALSPTHGNRQRMPATLDSKYAPPPPAEISDGVRTYEVGQKLGKGGFAICYEARERSGGAMVALKVVKTAMAKKVEEKFRTELQIHSKLRHRHVAEFVRAFSGGERTYVVLELCPRGSLKEMVGLRRRLSLPEVRRFSVQLCGALSYMHSRSVVHRDLKMANVFLGADMEPKVGDFGLAAVLLTDDQYGVIRRTTLCGTPNYIAPEVLSKGEGGHDTKADIWSLGVLIYTLLVGSTPFSRPGDQHNNDVFARVKTTDYEWPEQCRDTVPREARELVTELLDADSQSRPESHAVVEHPFFSMPGGIPESIEKECFRRAPSWLTRRQPQEMRGVSSKISLAKLCEQSGLGSVKNADYGRSVYHEFLAEEAEKRTPVMPLTCVYEARPATFSTKTARRKQANNISRIASRPALATAASHTSTRTASQGTNRSASGTINHDTRRHPPAGGAAAAAAEADLVETYTSLIGPSEPVITSLEPSTSSQVQTLQRMASHLSAFLKAEPATSDSLPWPDASEVALPPRVVRWCNYANKFGIGYTLADGTIGCIFTKNGRPAKGVVVPNTVEFYLSRAAANPPSSGNPNSTRDLLPPHGAPVQFYERTGGTESDSRQSSSSSMGTGSLRRLDEASRNFALNSVGKLGPTYSSPHASERRESLLLWSRFANYMTTKLGNDAVTPPMSGSSSSSSSSSSSLPPKTEGGAPLATAACFPTLYQRLGNVNVWVHPSLALEFDFPDHTKLLLSPTGLTAEFWHLPVHVADAIYSGGNGDGNSTNDNNNNNNNNAALADLLAASAAEYRACLRLPTRLFFAGPAAENACVKEAARANRLREKVGFVRDVVRMWAREGRAGALGREKVCWGGMEAVEDGMRRSGGGGGGGSGSGSGNERAAGGGSERGRALGWMVVGL